MSRPSPSSYPLEVLERRTLLAAVVLETGFGDGGYAPVFADRLLEVLPDGRILTARHDPDETLHPYNTLITALDTDGTVDTSFHDTDPPDQFLDSTVLVGAERYFVVGLTG